MVDYFVLCAGVPSEVAVAVQRDTQHMGTRINHVPRI